MDILFGNNFKHIHFVGILGSSMSSLAIFAKNLNYVVTGSDNCENISAQNTYAILQKRGIRIFNCHSAENIANADAVVFSSSIKNDNPEILAAIKKNICVVERGKFLSQIAKLHQNTIAIAGAHGKTTASGLVADIFFKQKRASFHIGGDLLEYSSSFKDEGREFFITEACEYKGNFLSLRPQTGIILNIEFDHPDYFENLEATIGEFEAFASNCRHLIVNADCENTKKITAFDKMKYSLTKRCDVMGDNLVLKENGLEFDIWFSGKKYHAKSNLTGKFNVYNILAAFSVCAYYNLDLHDVLKIIENHKGIRRRNEQIILSNSKRIILDYAHHPTQIFVMLSEFAKGKKKLCVFEPHTYSRTQSMLESFASALSLADEVILLPIYAAREQPVEGLLEKLCQKLPNCQIKQPSEALKYAENYDGEVLFLGAGNIDKIFSSAKSQFH